MLRGCGKLRGATRCKVRFSAFSQLDKSMYVTVSVVICMSVTLLISVLCVCLYLSVCVLS